MQVGKEETTVLQRTNLTIFRQLVTPLVLYLQFHRNAYMLTNHTERSQEMYRHSITQTKMRMTHRPIEVPAAASSRKQSIQSTHFTRTP